MKQTRPSRARSKWSFKTPRSHIPFANPDHSTPAPPHVQLLSRREATPTPSPRASSSRKTEEDSGATSSLSLDDSNNSTASLQESTTMTQPTQSSGFMFEDGEALRSHAEVSLEDFVRAPRRADNRRGRRGQQGQINIRIDSNVARPPTMQSPEARPTPAPARRMAPPPEFIPAAMRIQPVTPRQPRAMRQIVPQTDPQPLRQILETPEEHQQHSYFSPHTEPSQRLSDDALGNFIEAPTPIGGAIVYQKIVTHDAIGRVHEEWSPLGEIQKENMDSLYEFLATRSSYRFANGDFDRITYEAHKSQAIRQMCEDGQIQTAGTDVWALQSASSSQPSSQHDRTPLPPPGLLTTPQRFLPSQAQRIPDRTPVKTNYDPFSPPENRDTGYQRQQYDPFVSPVRERHEQDNAYIQQMTQQMAMENSVQWQKEEARRVEGVRLQREKSEKSMADTRRMFSMRQASISTTSAQQDSQIAAHEEPRRRTVLHDPYLDQPERPGTVRPTDTASQVSQQSSAQHANVAQPNPLRRSKTHPFPQLANDYSEPHSRYPSRASTALGNIGQQVQPSNTFDRVQPQAPTSASFAPDEEHHLASRMWPDRTHNPFSQAKPQNMARDQQNGQFGQAPAFLSQPADICDTFDLSKTRDQLLNPFPYRQSGQPPFFMDDKPTTSDPLRGKLETAEQRTDRIWSSGYRQHKQNMMDARDWITSIGKEGDVHAEAAAVLMIPLRENLAWYATEAETKHFPVAEDNAGEQRLTMGWPSKMTGSAASFTGDYFARQYDPMETAEREKIPEWLAGVN